MILDALGQLSDSQVATTNTTTVSTSSYDTGNVTPKNSLGDGEPMAVVFCVEAVTGAADTFTFEVIEDTAAALNAAVKTIVKSRVYAAAAIPVGTLLVLPIPPGQNALRYIGARYTLGAADALTVSAHLVPQSFVGKSKDYATAIVVA